VDPMSSIALGGWLIGPKVAEKPPAEEAQHE
jgi:hypothetical protein